MGRMTLASRIAYGMDRFYDRGRSKHAGDAATTEPTGSIADLEGHKYCVMVTYRKDGTAMPTPLWFGVGDGKVFAESGADAGKVKRIRNNAHVRVAPSDTRGAPTGPPFVGSARILGEEEGRAADRFIQANYGWYRTVYERLFAKRVATVIIEITPLPSQ
jgi:PPOX class probable F420-dependent enzyme